MEWSLDNPSIEFEQEALEEDQQLSKTTFVLPDNSSGQDSTADTETQLHVNSQRKSQTTEPKLSGNHKKSKSKDPVVQHLTAKIIELERALLKQKTPCPDKSTQLKESERLHAIAVKQLQGKLSTQTKIAAEKSNELVEVKNKLKKANERFNGLEKESKKNEKELKKKLHTTEKLVQNLTAKVRELETAKALPHGKEIMKNKQIEEQLEKIAKLTKENGELKAELDDMAIKNLQARLSEETKSEDSTKSTVGLNYLKKEIENTNNEFQMIKKEEKTNLFKDKLKYNPTDKLRRCSASLLRQNKIKDDQIDKQTKEISEIIGEVSPKAISDESGVAYISSACKEREAELRNCSTQLNALCSELRAKTSEIPDLTQSIPADGLKSEMRFPDELNLQSLYSDFVKLQKNVEVMLKWNAKDEAREKGYEQIRLQMGDLRLRNLDLMRENAELKQAFEIQAQVLAVLQCEKTSGK